MSRRYARLRETFPLLAAFGTEHRFLSPEEAVLATTEERIRSVWPYIVGRARSFCESLNPRERVSFDPEDVAVELWAVLAEKDDKWDHERGTYAVFAKTVCERHLEDVRDTSSVVERPKNSRGRIREYEEAEQKGALSPEQSKTMGDIRRAGGEIKPVDHAAAGSSSPDPASVAERREIERLGREALAEAIPRLTPKESIVLGRLHGLWGKEAATVEQIADEMGWQRDRAMSIRASAYAKLRAHFASVGHPASR